MALNFDLERRGVFTAESALIEICMAFVDTATSAYMYCEDGNEPIQRTFCLCSLVRGLVQKTPKQYLARHRRLAG